MLGFSRCWAGTGGDGQAGVTNRSLTTTSGSLYTNTEVGGRAGKQRTQRGKGEAEEGLDFLALGDFIANDMLILCGAKVNINGRENQICSGRGCGEKVDCIFNRKPGRSKSFQNGFVFN